MHDVHCSGLSCNTFKIRYIGKKVIGMHQGLEWNDTNSSEFYPECFNRDPLNNIFFSPNETSDSVTVSDKAWCFKIEIEKKQMVLWTDREHSVYSWEVHPNPPESEEHLYKSLSPNSSLMVLLLSPLSCCCPLLAVCNYSRIRTTGAGCTLLCTAAQGPEGAPTGRVRQWVSSSFITEHELTEQMNIYSVCSTFSPFSVSLLFQ